MNSQDILVTRLHNQQLANPTMTTPVEIVKWLGAVQAQDYAAAKWSLGLRLQHETDEQIEDAFNKGEILRTHVMRPTWHFILPEDILWMLELTAPRVRMLLNHYDRKLEITDPFLSTCFDIILKSLRGSNFLTRLQLAEELAKHNISASGQRLGHITAHAELAGLICSGPRISKQFTYANVTERAPNAKRLSREASLALLATRYFQSHGPAQVKDFAWWSGLSMKDAQEARTRVPSLASHEVDGKTYWSIKSLVKPAKQRGLFTSIFDEYTIAYKDRSDMSDERHVEKFISMGNALTGVMLFDGRVMGTWKRELTKDSVEIKFSPLSSITTDEKESFATLVMRYTRFVKKEHSTITYV
jgi:Winged helix DNA-binding domain